MSKQHLTLEHRAALYMVLRDAPWETLIECYGEGFGRTLSDAMGRLVEGTEKQDWRVQRWLRVAADRRDARASAEDAEVVRRAIDHEARWDP